MEQFINYFIQMASAVPYTVRLISFAVAIAFIIGGVVLYKKRGSIRFLRGKRWPGAACSLLGCASLVTTAIQYMI